MLPSRSGIIPPYLLTILIAAAIALVNLVSSDAITIMPWMPPVLLELISELVLAAVAVVLLTTRRSWRTVGFRPLRRLKDFRLYWVPVLPLLPVIAAVVHGRGLPRDSATSRLRRGNGVRFRCRDAEDGTYLASHSHPCLDRLRRFRHRRFNPHDEHDGHRHDCLRPRQAITWRRMWSTPVRPATTAAVMSAAAAGPRPPRNCR